MKRLWLMAVCLSGVLSVAPVTSYAAQPEASANPVDAALLNKGLDAVIHLSPGKNLDDVKKAIKASNLKIAQTKLDDEHPEKYQNNEAAPSVKAAVAASNSFTGASTESGRILLAQTAAGTYDSCSFILDGYCHAGIMDQSRMHGSINDHAVRTANTASNSDSGTDGMQWESPARWQVYAWVADAHVAGVSAMDRLKVRDQANSYAGPYTVATAKSTNTKWYCSKVVWRAYADVTGKDLDGDGGYFVYPGDIYMHADVIVDVEWA